MIPTQVGPYLIVEKIGAGGMGSVYLGHLPDSAEQVAIKVLPASLAHEEGFVERFGREIDSMKRLSNPHIVKLIDSGVDNGTYYYSMEYVPGETLTHLLRREKKVPWQQAIQIALQICLALKAAHDAGIIHRDLKPSNLLINPEGQVKLTDFGVAQVFAADRLTVTGGIVGTAEFMSPEQAQGKRANKQSDLYSLGAVLYALVCGRPPFTGATAVDVLQKHRFGRFDAPRLVNPEIPSWLEEIIVQLLEKDPEKRFPDAFVVMRRLEQVLSKVDLSEGKTAILDGYGVRDPGSPYRMEETQAEGDDGTAVHSGTDRHGPGPATLMKHLVREELEEPMLPRWLSQLLNSTWFLASMLVVVIGLLVIWSLPSTLSPEERFAAGMALLEGPESPDWLRARDQYFQPLLEQDPDTWREKITPYLGQIEIYELKRSLKISRLREKRNTEEDSVSEPYRWLALAQRELQNGDEIEAEKILLQVQTLLKGDPQQANLYDLCSRLLTELQQQRSRDTDRYAWVRTALQRAKQHDSEGQAPAARAIREAVIRLYADDSLAASFVAEARAALTTQ